MKSKRIRIGFIGVGSMGQAAHLRNYASLHEECEVSACADLSEQLRVAVAARYGIPRTYASGEELLANEELDAVVASQPFTRHGILLPQIAKKGVPIFAEKPLAASVEVGEKIVAALKENRTWLMVGYHKRSDPAVEYARQQILEFKESGEVGALRYVRISMPPGDWIAGGFNDLVPETFQRGEFENLELDPAPEDMNESTFNEYRTFVNYYIHQVNLLRYLLGENLRVTYADPAKVLLIGHSESGVPGVIEMNPYQTSVDWQEGALVAFEKGYIRIRMPAPLAFNRPGEVEVYRDSNDGAVPPQTTIPQLPWIHAMRNQALNFIKAVRGEAPPPCLAENALEDLRVAREYIRLLKGV